jgi:hypothetical protein
MRRKNCWQILVVAVVAVSGLTAPAWAVPYASGVRDLGGNMREFVLNEAADSVTVLRDGANPVNLGAIAAGRHTFDMTGFSTFSIEVSKNAPAAWTEISSASNLFTSFHRPVGLAVNTNPASPYFGTIYVGNSNAPAATVAGRTVGDGIYGLTADMIGVDLVTKLAVADPNDASQAKAPGFTTSGGANSPYRFDLDSAGNLIVGDWSDANGGIKYAAPDLASGGLILAEEDGVRPLLLDPTTNTHEMHGSIVSRPYFTGSVGNNLTLYGIDEDYDIDGDTLTASFGNSLWKWTPGNSLNYEGAPTLMMASNAATLSAEPVKYFSLNIGVQADARYNPAFDKWYISQSRTDGTESSLIILNADGTDADIADPNAPTVAWSSKGFSVDNNLDGFTDDAGVAVSIGIQDIFRESQTIAFSPDGTKMYLERTAVYGTNPTLGTADAPGAILIIPLDAGGLPALEIDDNGTPGDTTDDFISNIETITVAVQGVRQQAAEIYLDAAGNVYTSRASTTATPTAANSAQRLQVFSPGGNTKATTNSNGTFSVMTIAGVAGDYNDDGTVNAADYTYWRNHLGETSLPNEGGISLGTVDGADFDFWKSRYGETSGSGSGLGAGGTVPEPGSGCLAVLGMLVAGFLGVRRRKQMV